MMSDYHRRIQTTVKECLESDSFKVEEKLDKYVIVRTIYDGHGGIINDNEFWHLSWTISRTGNYMIGQFHINSYMVRLPLHLKDYIAKMSTEYIVMRKLQGLVKAPSKSFEMN